MQGNDRCGCGAHQIQQTGSPYWLQRNGVWTHLDGITPTQSIVKDRPRSDMVTVGGFRYAQQARNAPRTWEMSYVHATPEAVAALELAAQGAGTVNLWDEAAAAANLVCEVEGPLTAPVVPVNNMGLRALAWTNETPDEIVQTVTASWGGTYYLWGTVGPSTATGVVVGEDGIWSVLQFPIPYIPGYLLTGADFLMDVESVYDPGTIEVHWFESTTPPITSEGLMNTTPAALGVSRIPLTSSWVAAYQGTVFGVLVMPGNLNPAIEMFAALSRQALELTYTGSAENVRTYDTSFSFPEPTPFVVTFWSNAPQGSTVGTVTPTGGSAVNMEAPAGSGYRQMSFPFSAAAGGAVHLEPEAGNGDVAVGGLMVTTGTESPCRFVAGQCALAAVSVEDPSQERNFIFRKGGLGFGEWSVSVKEVCP